MYRYWLAAAFAIGMLGVSGCKRNEGMLPKTDGNQSSQAPRADPGSRDTAPAGKAAPGGY